MCIITTAVTSGVAIASAVTAALSTAISTTMGVISSVQQGKAQQAQLNYQAQVEKRNANIAQANADQKRQEGIEESRFVRMKNLQKVGAQQAALAANGVDISQGTALDIIEDTSAMGELDALTTRYNYETQAVANEQQAQNFQNQAKLDRFAGQSAYRSGIMNGIAQGVKGLGDLSSVASKWYSPNTTTSNSMSIVRGRRVSGGIVGDSVLYT